MRCRWGWLGSGMGWFFWRSSHDAEGSLALCLVGSYASGFRFTPWRSSAPIKQRNKKIVEAAIFCGRLGHASGLRFAPWRVKHHIPEWTLGTPRDSAALRSAEATRHTQQTTLGTPRDSAVLRSAEARRRNKPSEATHATNHSRDSAALRSAETRRCKQQTTNAC